MTVLIDPWLSNPLLNTPVEQVGKVDLILVTHGHGDHVGETVALAQKTGATVVAIHELSVILAQPGRAPGHRHEQGRHRDRSRASRSP